MLDEKQIAFMDRARRSQDESPLPGEEMAVGDMLYRGYIVPVGFFSFRPTEPGMTQFWCQKRSAPVSEEKGSRP